MATFAFPNINSFVSPFSIYIAFKILEQEGRLVYIIDLRKLDLTNNWTLRAPWYTDNRLPFDNSHYLSIILDPIPKDRFKFF